MDLPDSSVPSRPVFYIDMSPTETRFDWAERFFSGVRPPGVLTRKADRSLWFAYAGDVPRLISGIDEFQAKISALYNIVSIRTLPGGVQREVSARLSRFDAADLFYSVSISTLPELQAVVYEPAVLRNPLTGKLSLTPPGFDTKTGIFYYVPSGKLPITPVNSTEHLVKCFSGVPFESAEYRNNIFAWLLGALLFDERSEPPMLVISGNQPGVGKSKTMESCGIILTGQSMAPIDHSNEEFEKQLGARFREGTRFIGLDNIVTGTGRSYHNDKLSRILTSGWSKQVRILGHSRSVEQKGVLFALTANNCRLEADLAVRSLPVKLYRESLSPMIPFVLDYAKEYREEIYAELLGLALLKPPPMDPTIFPNFRFRSWLAFVWPRINATFGAMALDEARELDDAVHELFAWGENQASDYTFSAKMILDRMTFEPDKLKALTERFHDVTSERSRARLMTMFLKQSLNQVVSINTTRVSLRLHRAGDTNNPYLFRFERVEAPQDEAQ